MLCTCLQCRSPALASIFNWDGGEPNDAGKAEDCAIMTINVIRDELKEKE